MELQRKHSDVSERSAYSIHPRCSREFFRTQSSFLEAASDALADGRSEDSLELLERARSLFWAQALVTHTSIDGGLTIEERMSAYRFLTAGFDDAAQVALDARLHDMDTFVAESATRLHKCVLISKNYAAQISAHKDIPPFSFPALVHAAGGKTIVYLVCARTRCDAVVIKPSGIAQHIPLPGASPALLSRIVQGIKSQSAGNRSQRKSQLDQARAIRLRTGPIQDDSYSVDAGLATLWREVLEPIISGLALKKRTGRDRPHITWIPTGIFAFIPVHAAGIHHGPEQASCSDYFVSSYSSTIHKAAEVRASLGPILTIDAKVLLVAEPCAPGMPPLFEATREVEMIARALPPGTQLLPSTGTTSSVRNVLELLPHVSILHLACHGLEDTTNPHLSGFHLSDGRLTLAEIIQQDTPHALFAFLSACESARGHSVHHPEQSIHLAAALLFAGFKSVVGTLWDMSDVDGPVVAGAVYRELFKGDVLDPRIIPYALDEAVQELRRQGAPAHRWATFVHIGA